MIPEDDFVQRVLRQLDGQLERVILGAWAIQPWTERSGSTLTVADIDHARHNLNARLTVIDAEAFLRLGNEGYRTYAMLRSGGGLLVKTAELEARVLALDPEARVMVKPWLPEPMFAISRELWQSALEGERRKHKREDWS